MITLQDNLKWYDLDSILNCLDIIVVQSKDLNKDLLEFDHILSNIISNNAFITEGEHEPILYSELVLKHFSAIKDIIDCNLFNSIYKNIKLLWRR